MLREKIVALLDGRRSKIRLDRLAHAAKTRVRLKASAEEIDELISKTFRKDFVLCLRKKKREK
jgi:hypothetical protein